MGCELLAIMERRQLLKGVSTPGQGPRHAEHFTDVSLSFCSFLFLILVVLFFCSILFYSIVLFLFLLWEQR